MIRYKTDRRQLGQGGFTLVELLVAMSIGVLVMGFAIVFFVDTLRLSLGITNNLDIENSIRRVTNELSADARNANSFVIYKTFFDTGHEISGSFRYPAGNALTSSYRIRAGNSGNCCIFVYNGEDLTPLDLVPSPIERVVGYYLNNNSDGEGFEIRRFDVEIAASRQGLSIEELIPTVSDSDEHTALVQSANGLISGDLFYNLLGRSIIINSEIIYDLPNKTSGGTYNFTVSPRG
jgi:prepilin-type N-terminal cleavage/methylation domain-containing protein